MIIISYHHYHHHYYHLIIIISYHHDHQTMIHYHQELSSSSIIIIIMIINYHHQLSSSSSSIIIIIIINIVSCHGLSSLDLIIMISSYHHCHHDRSHLSWSLLIVICHVSRFYVGTYRFQKKAWSFAQAKEAGPETECWYIAKTRAKALDRPTTTKWRKHCNAIRRFQVFTWSTHMQRRA